MPNINQSDIEVTFSLVGWLNSQSVMLGTVLIHMLDCAGTLHIVFAFIDLVLQINGIILECPIGWFF